MQACTRQLRLLLALALGAGCTGQTSSGADELSVGTSSGAQGGMDGAGSIAVGLRWDADVFVQELWDEGKLRYLVFNRRPTTVEFIACLSGVCEGSQRVAGDVPAQSMRVFDAEQLELARPRDAWLSHFQLGDGSSLGSIFGPVRPVRGEHPVVSIVNQGDYHRAKVFDDAGVLTQVETDFVAASARTFTLTLSLPAGSPSISLLHKSEEVFSVPVLDVLAARSDTVPLHPIERGIVIAGTPNSAPRHLVEVDVGLPEGFEGSFVAFQAYPCAGSTDASDRLGIEVCGGAEIWRLFPVDPPRP